MTIRRKIGYDWYTYLMVGAVAVLVVVSLLAMFGSPSTAVRLPAGLSSAAAWQPPAVLLAALGFGIGCYGTIVGIGGGPLILPLLVFFYGWGNEFLVATSLFIVLLNAASGSAGYAAQKRIDYVGGIKFSLAAMPGALISSFTHHLFNLSFFNIIFAVFLILLAVFTISSVGKIDKTVAQRQKQLKDGVAHGFRRVMFTDRFRVAYDFYANDRLGITMNLLLGFFCGFLGIGGGVFQVPILVFLLNYPMHLATATSHFVTLLTCAVALLPHVFLGNVRYAEALWMGVGVVLGAQAGARIAVKLNSKVMLYLFIVVLLVFAVRLFLA